jgi:hypothetical protein
VIHWRAANGPNAGHAALIIDTQQFAPRSAEYYVSWVGAGGKTPLQQIGNAQTYVDDLRDFGARPTRWVVLKKLDIAAMKQEWDIIRNKPNDHWKLFDKNCATWGCARPESWRSR